MGGRHESGIHIVRLSFMKVVYSKSFTEKGWRHEALYTRWRISPQQLKSWCRFSCPWLTGEELDCRKWRNWPGSDWKPASQRRCVCVCVCVRAHLLGCQVKCLSHSAGCGENRSWAVSVWQTSEPVLLSSPPIRPASLQPGCSWSLSQGPALLGGCSVCVVTGPVILLTASSRRLWENRTPHLAEEKTEAQEVWETWQPLLFSEHAVRIFLTASLWMFVGFRFSSCCLFCLQHCRIFPSQKPNLCPRSLNYWTSLDCLESSLIFVFDLENNDYKLLESKF